MSAGLEVRTNGKNLIINQEYKNLAFKRKIAVSSLPFAETALGLTDPWNSFASGNLPQYNLALNDDEILFGVTICPNINRIMIRPSDAKNVRFRIPSGTDLSGMYIYTFGWPTNSGTNCGLQVFNGNNEIVFDSGHKYLNVIECTRGLYCIYEGVFWTTALIFCAPTVDTQYRYSCWYCETKDRDASGQYIWPEWAIGQGLTASSVRGVLCPALVVDVTNY